MTNSGSDVPLIVDSNLIIYSVLDEHPAAPACRAYIARQEKITLTLLTPIESYFVLTRIYGVAETQAANTVERLLRTPIELVQANEADIVAALQICAAENLDINDALQLHLCQRLGIAHLATDDKRLGNLSRAVGLTVDNPIDETLRQRMADWERIHLPQKGMPRLLGRIYD
ncbi:MAG: PIN domain-containing protein [Thermoflexales bacterium]|nr:PIN domain-containing protein [Thermoflexales bacterium]